MGDDAYACQGSRRLERLTWPAFQAAAQTCGSTVVWPFGAFEQHGPHLPLGTDALFAEQILDQVLETFPRRRRSGGCRCRASAFHRSTWASQEP